MVLHKIWLGLQLQAPAFFSSSFSFILATVNWARRSTALNFQWLRICFAVRGSLGAPSGSAQQRKPRK